MVPHQHTAEDDEAAGWLLLLRAGAWVPCCRSRSDAACGGHYECFTRLSGPLLKHCPAPDLFPFLCRALQHGHVEFAKRLYDEFRMGVTDFAQYCIRRNDAVSLHFAIRANPGMTFGLLCLEAAYPHHGECLRLLLENGAPWKPYYLAFAARDNRLDILDLVLPLTGECCGEVAACASWLGHVRFLMRIFADFPLWYSARDEEPELDKWGIPWFSPDSQRGWSLVVSSDLVRSGPVLLYAAQQRVPLTARMEGMLGEVRRRALALAGCFHRAARLRQGPGAVARKWDAMGRVPVEIIERIATLAKLSVVSLDLVE